ncbi:lymphocyte-specific helicase-like [Palaemon carinicauda]|uniref:lymphocyte-specific helicase-like n=1 Tax=Palaemon carinicauda TaxID=392227 RepID=UPI0035B60139
MPQTDFTENAEITTLDDDRQSLSSGSLSPGRPASASPTHPEEAHGLSRDQTPEASEGENSNGKWDETQNLLLTSEIEAEERKMEEKNLAEEEMLRKEMEERRMDEKELKEKRYKRLMHLLNKSEFYSQFLLKQIESHDKENKMKRVRKPKEAVQSEDNSSQESNGSKKRRMRRSASRAPASKRHCLDGKYNIGDVINTETVKENSGAKEETTEDTERVEQPRLFINGTMRPYQLDGYSWLTVLYENGVNGILGDEMGLGKTIQCIALISHLVDKGVQGPFLIVGPLSTLPNWIAEFKRFAPAVPVVLYHGSDSVRAQKARSLYKKFPVEGAPHDVHPVIVTSFEVVIRDTKILNKFHWRYICVDEGHRLKNHKCRLAKSLNTFPSSNRLLMTGTPLQNSLAELWSLLNFLMPEIFDSLDVFESWFDITDMMEDGSDEKIVQQEREQQIITTLMKILSPFFLRRVKKDVNLDIPPKRELYVYTPMTPLQLEWYEATLKMDTEVFDKMKQESVVKEPIEYDSKGRPKRRASKKVDYKVFDAEYDSSDFQSYLSNKIREEDEETKDSKKLTQKTSVLNVKLQNRAMQMRRIVNHPYLLNYPLNKDGSFKIDEELVKSCGKLQVLDQLLKELHKRGHRVLIFSQMTMMMDILEDYLTLRPQYRYKRLDGCKSLDERQQDIEGFNDKKSTDFLYLISTRAGSLGINLATADTVIIYDSDWNPQCDLQAQDRCHRIGQTKPVLVLRLITASSIDERIVDRAGAKRKLEKMIIQSGKFKAGNAKQRGKMLEMSIDADELLELLKQRDHDRIHNTTTGNIFSQKEIDQLLDRSDMVVRGSSSPRKGKGGLKGVFKLLEEEEEGETLASA